MTADAARSDQAAPLALYRRYRPATFAELKGQDHVTEPLRQALRSGRVNHAYLFSGPRGCGKTSSARILARSLNCELGPTPDPCGECQSCVALAPSGPGSIDVIEIDAASHGGIDDARDLRERAFYSPVAARYKIYIIDEAHMVTGAGFNALLKLVEEPPPHLKFVFATTEPEKVIPTIRSRTHHYPFRLVPPAVLRELLEEILSAEKVEFEPAVLPVVIRAGAGSVRDSLSVLDQLIAGADDDGLRYDRAIALLGYTDDALLDEMTDAFAASDGGLVFGAIDHVVEGGHDPRRFAMDLLDRLRDLIVLAAVPDASAAELLDVPEDRLDRMRQQAKNFGSERLVRAAQTISNGLVEMRGATSPRLLLELMCAQVLLPPAPAGQSGPPGASGPADAGLDTRVQRLERELTSVLDRLARAGSGTAAPAPAEPPASPRPTATRPPERAPERSERQPERGPGRQPDADQPRPSAPPPEPPSRPAPAGRVGSGPPDTATLSGRWSDVLDAVREVRKVAWILLSNATVESVEGSVLTLAFAREGDAKGFASSGCDQDLADVLDRMFGARLMIKPVVQSVSSRSATAADAAPPRPPSSRPGDAGSSDSRPGDPRPGDPRPGDPRPGDPRPGDPRPGDSRAGGRRGDDSGAGDPRSGDSRSGDSRAGDPGAESSAFAAGGPASSAEPESPPAEAARPARAERAAPRSRAAKPSSRPDPAASPADDPRLHTDPDPPGAANQLTGSDLILRELGGTVIAESGED